MHGFLRNSRRCSNFISELPSSSFPPYLLHNIILNLLPLFRQFLFAPFSSLGSSLVKQQSRIRFVAMASRPPFSGPNNEPEGQQSSNEPSQPAYNPSLSFATAQTPSTYYPYPGSQHSAMQGPAHPSTGYPTQPGHQNPHMVGTSQGYYQPLPAPSNGPQVDYSSSYQTNASYGNVGGRLPPFGYQVIIAPYHVNVIPVLTLYWQNPSGFQPGVAPPTIPTIIQESDLAEYTQQFTRGIESDLVRLFTSACPPFPATDRLVQNLRLARANRRNAVLLQHGIGFITDHLLSLSRWAIHRCLAPLVDLNYAILPSNETELPHPLTHHVNPPQRYQPHSSQVTPANQVPLKAAEDWVPGQIPSWHKPAKPDEEEDEVEIISWSGPVGQNSMFSTESKQEEGESKKEENTLDAQSSTAEVFRPDCDQAENPNASQKTMATPHGLTLWDLACQECPLTTSEYQKSNEANDMIHLLTTTLQEKPVSFHDHFRGISDVGDNIGIRLLNREQELQHKVALKSNSASQKTTGVTKQYQGISVAGPSLPDDKTPMTVSTGRKKHATRAVRCKSSTKTRAEQKTGREPVMAENQSGRVTRAQLQRSREYTQLAKIQDLVPARSHGEAEKSPTAGKRKKSSLEGSRGLAHPSRRNQRPVGKYPEDGDDEPRNDAKYHSSTSSSDSTVVVRIS